jgi:hypothetical protein
VCGVILGWKYVSAEEEAQKYKEGCFILETRRVMRCVDWDNDAVPAFTTPDPSATEQKRKDSGWSESSVGGSDDVLEFDSQDEDECEDLFMGIWSPSLAKKRRRAKALSS